MATIAEKLVKINDAKQGIKTAIEAKGVTVGDAPLAEYADKISEISGGGGEQSRYGTTLDSFWGSVDENGTLSAPSEPVNVVLTGVKKLANRALYYKWYDTDSIISFTAPDLTTIDNYGMYYAITSCSKFTDASFPALTTINSSGMYNAFYFCLGLTNVSFPVLDTIGDSGLYYAFQASSSNKGVLSRIDFPALISVRNNSFGSSSGNYAFRYRCFPEGIHFRADMQETIEAMTGYSAKWGTVDTSIYFDL